MRWRRVEGDVLGLGWKESSAAETPSATHLGALLMDSQVEWVGGQKLTCTGKDGVVMELGWGGEVVNPVMATLHSCGACSLIDVVEGLKNREVTRAVVELDLERAENNPRVFTKIHMIYRVEGVDLPEKLIRRLIEKSHAKYCTVSNMLKHTADITWDLVMDG